MKKQCFTIIAFLSFFLAGSIYAQSQEQKQSYAQIQGQILNEWRKPVGGVSVMINSQSNGYSTNNLVSISDVNGKYSINNIPRYIYSQGPEPRPVQYYLTVNNPGYEQYASESFDFSSEINKRQDIRLKTSSYK